MVSPYSRTVGPELVEELDNQLNINGTRQHGTAQFQPDVDFRTITTTEKVRNRHLKQRTQERRKWNRKHQ